MRFNVNKAVAKISAKGLSLMLVSKRHILAALCILAKRRTDR